MLTSVFSVSDLHFWKRTISQILLALDYFMAWVFKTIVEGIESV